MQKSAKTIVFILVVITIVAGVGYTIQNDHSLGKSLIGAQSGGNLDVYIYNMPVNYNVSAVYMTFSSVSLYVNFIGWTNYTLNKKTVEISNPTQSSTILLSNMTMTPQNFTAIRLNLAKVTATVGGNNHTLSLTNSIVFISHSFSILYNKTTDIDIMFDLSNDLNLNNSAFTPNIESSFYTGNESSPQSGTANFFVYDAPLDNVSAVYLNFSAVALHGVQTGWTNYSVSNHSIDILNLSSANASLLNSLKLTPQSYTMIRLYMQNVTVTVNGVNETFRMASSTALINHPFNISANGVMNLKIQFNLNQDINVNGKVFTPVIGSAEST